MKRKAAFLAMVSVFIVHPSWSVLAATTIDPVNKYAYGANVGWMDWRGDTNNGAVIGEFVCSGYIYAANIGWIHLGSGAPANGIQYQNNSAVDYGVNNDALGNLRGYAYGANIGWVNFENTGAPKVDLWSGKLSGYAWSANCGWISLSNASAWVQTTTIAAGADTDGDGIPDAWERMWFGNLTTATSTSDYDGDGMSDKQECWAGTNPADPNDKLRIATFKRGSFGDPNRIDMIWTSKSSRYYVIERRTSLNPGSPWVPFTTGFESIPGWNNIGFDDTLTQRYYRIRVVRPLMP